MERVAGADRLETGGETREGGGERERPREMMKEHERSAAAERH